MLTIFCSYRLRLVSYDYSLTDCAGKHIFSLVSGKIINFDKLKGYATSSYAFLWVILFSVVALVPLTGAVLITQFGSLRASAASSSAVSVCTFSPASVEIGKSITVSSNRGNVFGEITIQGAYLPTAIPLGTVAKQNSATVKVPFVDSGLYAVRVGTPGVTCKTAAGGDLAIQNTIVPAPIETPKPTTMPTPVAVVTSCYINTSSVKAGGSVTISGKGFGGLTYTANLLGLSTTQFYTLGEFNGNSGTYTIPATISSGVYTIRIFSGSAGDNGILCPPDLMVN